VAQTFPVSLCVMSSNINRQRFCTSVVECQI